jgi:hypothetical protein
MLPMELLPEIFNVGNVFSNLEMDVPSSKPSDETFETIVISREVANV